jgi:hypothetical protein
MKQLMFHDDPAFWFETLRNLGLAAYGGSDVGEVIATASRIDPARLPPCVGGAAGREPPLARPRRVP